MQAIGKPVVGHHGTLQLMLLGFTDRCAPNIALIATAVPHGCTQTSPGSNRLVVFAVLSEAYKASCCIKNSSQGLPIRSSLHVARQPNAIGIVSQSFANPSQAVGSCLKQLEALMRECRKLCGFGQLPQLGCARCPGPLEWFTHQCSPCQVARIIPAPRDCPLLSDLEFWKFPISVMSSGNC